MSKYTILDKINTPSDLKLIPESQLKILSAELRAFLVDTLDVSGGHFASSLGATELTVALHYVYNAPYDNIVWDVGHQTYIHKILTGRKDKLVTIKKMAVFQVFLNAVRVNMTPLESATQVLL